ncbi:MAG: nucleotide-binding universal stress UspA family protein [Gammaproteobacteria bacterium]|jgi:nucleotide-binding universal stress UspA family protein
MSNNKVLIPLTQSEQSQEILPYVEKFIGAGDNDLILFFITKPPSGVGFETIDSSTDYVNMLGDGPPRPSLHPIYATQQQDSIKAHVEAELIPVTNRLTALGYNTSLVVSFDKDPVDAILKVVKKKKIDLIAMSTKARVGVTRFFFRGISDVLSLRSNIPVLLVHPSEE